VLHASITRQLLLVRIHSNEMENSHRFVGHVWNLAELSLSRLFVTGIKFIIILYKRNKIAATGEEKFLFDRMFFVETKKVL